MVFLHMCAEATSSQMCSTSCLVWLCWLGASSMWAHRNLVWCCWHRMISCSCHLLVLLIALCAGSWVLLGLFYLFRAFRTSVAQDYPGVALGIRHVYAATRTHNTCAILSPKISSLYALSRKALLTMTHVSAWPSSICFKLIHHLEESPRHALEVLIGRCT